MFKFKELYDNYKSEMAFAVDPDNVIFICVYRKKAVSLQPIRKAWTF